jgi:Tat protein secretion system quality control protein TatD with DNase activity
MWTPWSNAPDAPSPGSERMVSIGADLKSGRRAIALAERFPAVFAAVGWHPGHAEEAPDSIREPLLELARHPRVVAIGECGIRLARLPSKSGGSESDDARVKENQKRLFIEQEQLEVAAEVGLNAVVHTRESFKQSVDVRLGVRFSYVLLAKGSDRLTERQNFVIFNCSKKMEFHRDLVSPASVRSFGA